MENYRFERRKFLSQIHGRVQNIEIKKYRAIQNYDNESKRDELRLSKGTWFLSLTYFNRRFFKILFEMRKLKHLKFEFEIIYIFLL